MTNKSNTVEAITIEEGDKVVVTASSGNGANNSASNNERKEVVLAEEVLTMSEKIRKEMSIEKDGTVIMKDGIYYDCLPVGISREIDELVRKNREVFSAAAGHAVGMSSISAYKGNKGLESISATFPMSGKDKLIIQSKRQSTHVNPRDRSATVESFGSIKAVIETSMGNKDSGHFAAVSRFVKNAAADALRDL